MNSPSNDRGINRVFLALLVLAIAAAFLLQLQGMRQQSLTGDGAHHLLAASQMIHFGQNRINWEHPPLAKLVFGLGLLFEPPLSGPLLPEQTIHQIDSVYENRERLRRITARARWLHLILIVMPMLAACFFLGKRYGGNLCGMLLLLMLGLSFDLVGQFSTLQTDVAVTLGFTLTLLAVLGMTERPSVWRAAFLGLGLGLALAAKFSAIVLIPVVLLALGSLSDKTWGQRLRWTAVVAATSLLVLNGVYLLANRKYEAEIGQRSLHSYTSGQAMMTDQTLVVFQEPLSALETASPALAQWLTGLLGVTAQNYLGVYPTYALGHLSTKGRLWFFPVLLLLKIPIAILVTFIFLLREKVRRASWKGLRIPKDWVLYSVLGIYLGAAILSNYNIGFRHLLPILPLVYLPVAAFLSRRPRAAALVVIVLALEASLIAPLWTSSANLWWLGGRNPARFWFSTGVLENGQNFVALGEALQAKGVESAHVLYEGIGPHQLAAYVPSAVLTHAGEIPAEGWCVVSVVLEQFVPVLIRQGDPSALGQLARKWKISLEAAQSGEDHGYLAGSFHLYRLTRHDGTGD